MLNTDLQYKIDKLIEARGLSKTWIAKTIGVSRETVYNLDRNTKIDTYLKLCEILKVEISDLLYTPVQNIIKEPSENYNKTASNGTITLKGKKTIQIDLQKFELIIK